MGASQADMSEGNTQAGSEIVSNYVWWENRVSKGGAEGGIQVN